MNDIVKKLMEDSGYAAPQLASRAINLVDNVLQECIDQLYLNGYDDAATHLATHFQGK